MNKLQEEFNKKGFVVLKSLLSKEEVKFYREELERLSGINEENFHQVKGNATKKLNGVINYKLFTGADGLTQNPNLWSLIFHDKILEKVKTILGDKIRFVQHNDTHVGFSASSWHRDSAFRTYGEGPDWETDEPYQNVRVAVYLQTFEQSNFKLGMIPKSNKKQSILLSLELWLNQVVKFKSLVFGQRMWFVKNEWVRTDPGDIIIFDPRVLHRGGYIKGPKYSIFFAFGIENKHYVNYNNYYLKKRKDLKYSAIPKELIGRLKEADLYPENYDFNA
ncbi:MAG: ectoine hydroxylase-related dioxygenase (phytanoyl-CoA dioxygenase family) [Polaribacter sp.]|jgi:ectoine hydroxylase-related dioxygenase (phytanoyl-CoA dioxygenase family)